MNVDRNIKLSKLPDLILPTLLLSKTDNGLRRFFRKIGKILERFGTLDMGVALEP